MATVNRGAARETKTGDARILATGQDVIVQEAQALRSLAQDLDGNFADAVKQIIRTRDRVVVTGIGKSGHIGRKAAATLASTGTPAFFLHAAEAAHGDLGMVGAQDTLLVISNSGLTREIRPLLSHGRRLGTPIIGIASTLASPLGRQADILLRLPRAPEACPARIAPTTSTTMMLALCDALALAVMRERGIERNDLARLHPGGDIGYRLSPIDELIDRDMPLPLVRAEAPLRDVVLEMTSVGKGIAGVVDAHGALIGVITDGDLRRSFDQVLIARAGEVMTRTPITVPSGTTIGDCHDLMTDSKITVVFVTDRQDERRPVGLVNIHDLAMLS